MISKKKLLVGLTATLWIAGFVCGWFLALYIRSHYEITPPKVEVVPPKVEVRRCECCKACKCVICECRTGRKCGVDCCTCLPKIECVRRLFTWDCRDCHHFPEPKPEPAPKPFRLSKLPAGPPSSYDPPNDGSRNGWWRTGHPEYWGWWYDASGVGMFDAKTGQWWRWDGCYYWAEKTPWIGVLNGVDPSKMGTGERLLISGEK